MPMPLAVSPAVHHLRVYSGQHHLWPAIHGPDLQPGTMIKGPSYTTMFEAPEI